MIAAAQQPPAFNVKAFSWTVGIHALILLLFLLFRYSVPAVVPAADGNGMEVNLGTSENGSGTDQPMSKEDPAAFSAAVVYKNAAEKTDLPKNMMQSTDADAMAIKAANDAKRAAGTGADNSKAIEHPKAKYDYQGETGKGGNAAAQNAPGTSEGITNGPGDQGVKGGTPGAANYTGAPGTGGIGHTLTGRSITPAKFEAEFREGGTVVFHVTVDRQGNIVSKYVKSSSSPQLTKLALDKLSKARFSPTNSSEPQQFGDVTIIFKAR